jgi:hypothetical protein
MSQQCVESHRAKNPIDVPRQPKKPHASTAPSKPLALPITLFAPISLARQQKISQVIPPSAEKVPEAVGTAKRDWIPPA